MQFSLPPRELHARRQRHPPPAPAPITYAARIDGTARMPPNVHVGCHAIDCRKLFAVELQSKRHRQQLHVVYVFESD